MEFKVRERVNVWNPDRTMVFEGEIININDFRPTEMEYCVLLKGYWEEVFVGENQLEKLGGKQ